MNQKKPSGLGLRVNRGGSWFDEADYCRSANRLGCSPSLRGSGLGFRPAVTLDRFTISQSMETRDGRDTDLRGHTRRIVL